MFPIISSPNSSLISDLKYILSNGASTSLIPINVSTSHTTPPTSPARSYSYNSMATGNASPSSPSSSSCSSSMARVLLESFIPESPRSARKNLEGRKVHGGTARPAQTSTFDDYPTTPVSGSYRPTISSPISTTSTIDSPPTSPSSIYLSHQASNNIIKRDATARWEMITGPLACAVASTWVGIGEESELRSEEMKREEGTMVVEQEENLVEKWLDQQRMKEFFPDGSGSTWSPSSSSSSSSSTSSTSSDSKITTTSSPTSAPAFIKREASLERESVRPLEVWVATEVKVTVSRMAERTRSEGSIKVKPEGNWI